MSETIIIVVIIIFILILLSILFLIYQKIKPTNMNFLEKSWTYFMWVLHIEGIIKDLIVLKKNPQFIDELNNLIVSKELTEKREEYAKKPFIWCSIPASVATINSLSGFFLV